MSWPLTYRNAMIATSAATVLTGVAMLIASVSWDRPPGMVSAPPSMPFSEQWRVAVTDIAIVKPVALEPKMVKTERIFVPNPEFKSEPEPAAPEVAEVAEPPPPPPRRHDLCRGKGKVYSGRSWRCRR